MPPNETATGQAPSTDKGMKCKVCSKKFLLQGNLIKHEATAHSNKPFNCRLCNKGFHQEANLIAHEKIHNLGGMTSQLSSIKIPRVPKKVAAAGPKSDSDEDMPALMLPVVRSMKETALTGHIRKTVKPKKTVRPTVYDPFGLFGDSGIDSAGNQNTSPETIPGQQEEMPSQVSSQPTEAEAEVKRPAMKRTFRCEKCSQDIAWKTSLSKKIHAKKCPKNVSNPSPDKSEKSTSEEKSIEEPLTCKHCDKEFFNKIKLQRHESLHKEATKQKKKLDPLTCKLCKKAFTTSTGLGIHERRAHGLSKKKRNLSRYSCEECPKAFESMSALKVHSVVHTKQTPYPCDVCDIKFRYKAQMVSHKKRVHRPNPAYKKTEENELKSDKAATEGDKVVSNREKQYGCKSCGKKFRLNISLQVHLRKCKKSKRTFRCENCSQDIAWKTSRSKDFHAKKCQKNTQKVDKIAIKIEQIDAVKSSAKKTFQCNQCNETFPWKTSLSKKIHMKKCKGKKADEPVDPPARKPNTCSECNKGPFPSKAHLTRHMRVHTGEKPFACRFCDYRCAQKVQLKTHVLKHHADEKGPSCHICDKKFSTKVKMADHKRDVHGMGKPARATRASLDIKPSLESLESPAEKPRDKKPVFVPRFRGLQESTDQQSDGQSEESEGGDNNMEVDTKPVMPVVMKSARVELKRLEETSQQEVNDEGTVEKDKDSSPKADIKPSLETSGLVKEVAADFPCPICEQRFTIQADFIDHCKKHEKQLSKESEAKIGKTFKCSICTQQFDSNDKMVKHKESHNEKPFPCRNCKQSYHQKEDYLIHVKEYHPDQDNVIVKPEVSSDKPFGCKTCGAHFMFSSTLTKHQVIHSVKKPYNCDKCDKTFRILDLLRQHQIVHTDERPYKCETCGDSFKMKHHLKEHMLSHSTLNCPKCDFTCKRPKSLTTHMAKDHPVKPDPETVQLQAPRSTKVVKKEPESSLIEAEDTPFGCSKCSRSFADVDSLAEHENEHRERFECETCSKVFSKKANLKIHNMMVHGISDEQDVKAEGTVEEQSFGCHRCSETFPTVDTLLKHEETHVTSLLKPFQCQECNEGFDNQKMLSRHVAISHGQSYTCKICGKKFTSRDIARRHVTKVHDADNPGSHVEVQGSVQPSLQEESVDGQSYYCKICDKQYTNRTSARRHVSRMHDADNPLSHVAVQGSVQPTLQGLDQPTLQEEYVDLSGGFGDHFLLGSGSQEDSPVDMTVEVQVCAICQKTFGGKSGKANLSRHMKNMHRRASVKMCEPKSGKNEIDYVAGGVPAKNSSFSHTEKPTEAKSAQREKDTAKRESVVCGLCQVKVSSAEQLKQHRRVCKRASEPVNSVETEPVTDKVRPDRINAIEKVGSSSAQTSQTCELCPSQPSFDGMKNFTHHITSIHKMDLDKYKDKVKANHQQVEYLTESQTFLAACKVCCAILISESGLARHVDEKHDLTLDEYNVL